MFIMYPKISVNYEFSSSVLAIATAMCTPTALSSILLQGIGMLYFRVAKFYLVVVLFPDWVG